MRYGVGEKHAFISVGYLVNSKSSGGVGKLSHERRGEAGVECQDSLALHDADRLLKDANLIPGSGCLQVDFEQVQGVGAASSPG